MIDNLWTEPKHYFYPDQIWSAIERPSVTKRSTPFEIDYPNSINQTIEIELPGQPLTSDDSDTISDTALLLSYKHISADRKIRLEYSLKSLTDSVPAEAVGRHLQTIELMRSSLGLELARDGMPMIRTRTTGRGSSAGAVFASIFLAVTFAVIFAGYKLRSRRTRQKTWNVPVKARAGTTVTSAITVSTANEITSYLQNSSCDCGNNLYRDDAPPVRERFTYDGQSLTGVRLKCAACTRSTDFYFRHQAEAVQPAG
jgi:hypothetical protein